MTETIYDNAHNADGDEHADVARRARALMLAHADATCPSWCADHATGIREQRPAGRYQHLREYDYDGPGWVVLSCWHDAATGASERAVVHVCDLDDAGLSAAQARSLAATLLDAADALDGERTSGRTEQ